MIANTTKKSKSTRMNLTHDAVIVRRNDRHLTNPVGDETVLLDLQSGDYLGLDPVASSIWSRLQAPQTLTSLVQALMEEYEVGEEECRRDTLEFLQRIDDMGLIERVS
jgi:hypothetical protein